jgi:hypothetical protein
MEWLEEHHIPEVVALIILPMVLVLARYGKMCDEHAVEPRGHTFISGCVSVQMVTEEECRCRISLVSQAVSLDVIF